MAADPTPSLDDIATNLRRVQAAIAAAARLAGRDPRTVELVAVSKTHPAARVRAALAAGHRIFGENRVQEAQGKYPDLRGDFPDLRLHLIGPLQTNKVRDAVRLFDVIETVDRSKLAGALAAAMAEQGRHLDCLVQVNIGREPQKAGIAPEQADTFIEECRQTHRLAISGLMCIPPAGRPPEPYFMQLREIARRHDLQRLSMGMSADFEIAVRCGATSVRVGTAIFGARSSAPG